MATYTNFLEQKGYDIDQNDDNYIEELLEVANLFRNFDEALDTFIANHGYTGDISDIDAKAAFIKSKFEQAKIPVPRNLKKWYTEHKKIVRKTAFQICFAFHLTVEETEDFLRRMCLERGFDCHNQNEAIYFYCMSNQLSYQDAQQLIKKVPKVEFENVNMKQPDWKQDVFYTSSIVENIKRFGSPEQLVSYINDNIHQFKYNNVRAYELIRNIWNSISIKNDLTENGLADWEKKNLYAAFGGEEKADKKKTSRTSHQKQKGNKDEDKAATDSLWKIYLQILGLAEDSFPDRDGLHKILNGVHVPYERVRKILILVVFYKFWVSLALKRRNYQAEYGDGERCISKINGYLLDAGYPALYAGNPFDWIFMFVVENEMPLVAFRDFMRELFYMNEQEGGVGSAYAIGTDLCIDKSSDVDL